jgi:prepilin-type N-terminal cleavage/methylation domain-containing protein
MNHRRAKRAFTLIELMVAVGLMGLIIAFSSIIFRFGIDAHRIATANAEIMQKARAITEQLNADFKGLRKDAPLLVWFQQDIGIAEPNRYDQIMFFADGDFSSWRMYGLTGQPVPLDQAMSSSDKVIRGNVARIQYGLASRYVSATNHNRVLPSAILDKTDRNLARRCHILTADGALDRWPDPNQVNPSIGDTWPLTGGLKNDEYEHDSVSLSRWKALDATEYDPLSIGSILHTCFDYPPLFDSRDPNTFGELLSEHVSSFAVQIAYWDQNTKNKLELRWFPSDNPDGDKLTSDSHFDLMTSWYKISEPQFGVVFNVRGTNQMDKWMRPGMLRYDQTNTFANNFFPAALKFTFTIYDSKGIIKNGKTFTHIVYFED